MDFSKKELKLIYEALYLASLYENSYADAWYKPLNIKQDPICDKSWKKAKQFLKLREKMDKNEKTKENS